MRAAYGPGGERAWADGCVCSIQTRTRLDIGGEARAERTRNISRMVVTLDVSKLSDWLNTNAPCRVEERTHKVGSMRAGIREGVWGGGGACSVQAKTQLGIGRRARAERTWNMSLIFVTLDVSRLSGWLNAVAYCRVERRECDVGRGAAREA